MKAQVEQVDNHTGAGAWGQRSLNLLLAALALGGKGGNIRYRNAAPIVDAESLLVLCIRGSHSMYIIPERFAMHTIKYRRYA